MERQDLPTSEARSFFGINWGRIPKTVKIGRAALSEAAAHLHNRNG